MESFIIHDKHSLREMLSNLGVYDQRQPLQQARTMCVVLSERHVRLFICWITLSADLKNGICTTKKKKKKTRFGESLLKKTATQCTFMHLLKSNLLNL